MFYIEKNSKVVLSDTDRNRIERTLAFMPQYSLEDIRETGENETIVNWKVVSLEEAEEIRQAEEQDRINKLSMTALDFIKLLQSTGLSSAQIKEYLEAHIELDMQLKYCQNVYCGVVRQLLPLTVGDITITDEMVVNAFKSKRDAQ